jgi:hypothetical protein
MRRTTSAPPGQSARQGRTPKLASAAPSHHSNAPIKPESQSILSKIVAHWAQHRGALLAIFGGNCEQPTHSESEAVEASIATLSPVSTPWSRRRPAHFGVERQARRVRLANQQMRFFGGDETLHEPATSISAKSNTRMGLDAKLPPPTNSCARANCDFWTSRTSHQSSGWVKDKQIPPFSYPGRAKPGKRIV